MQLSEEEEKELSLLMAQYPLVGKIWTALKAWEGEDPAKKVYSQFCKLVSTMGEDMESLSQGRTSGVIINGASDDKLFDRALNAISKMKVMFEALDIGKKMAFPEPASEKETEITGKVKFVHGPK